MSRYKRLLLFTSGLIASMFIAGISSEAMAAPTVICHFIGTVGETRLLTGAEARRHLNNHPNDHTGKCRDTKFVLVAVSGTLEEGFALRPNLDFISEINEGNKAVLGIFLGHALVRGVKAFLDIKDPNSREFAASGNNPINPGLVASGNNNDANISSLYFVDRRQAARALLREPRYLSMVPDLGKVEIDATETDPDVRNFIRQAIQEDTSLLAPKNMNQVTLLQVISTWNSCHFVPSPPITVKLDGTRVTDFPNSLALFAGTTAPIASAQYFADVDAVVRTTLALPADQPGSGTCVDNPSAFPIPPLPGGTDPLTSYAVDKSTKRMNDAYRPCQLEELLTRAGVAIQVAQCPN